MADIKAEFGSVLGGRCECGAVYVCDPTGHNTGEAYMEALALSKGNWQLNGIEENVDYETETIDYDEKSHQTVYSKGNSSLSGRLVFVKVKSGTESSLPEQRAQADSPSQSRISTPGGKTDMKGKVRKLLESRDYEDVAQMARQDRGVIRWLISLAYDKEEEITWRAIEAVGVISKKYSKEIMDVLRDTVRRLLWSMGEESGGIGWSAAEMLGEIIAGDPDAFNDIVPILWSFKEEDMFRSGILWAMGRISLVRPDMTAFIADDLPGMMRDPNPNVRGYAAWVAGISGAGNLVEHISRLLDDASPVAFYRDGNLTSRTLSEIARDAMHKMPK
ncbi:MAG: hypothetical protein HQL08_01865 [Nitrospirae bacterium]|nr:hypothetical protein [Nitrospirota bacterium]